MELINKYFPDLSEKQIEQLKLLLPVYKNWNSKINVISRNDIDNLYERHVLYSLSILKFFKFPNGITFLDVGTGGGFPGIPLAILLENCKFTLIDSVGKKIQVVDAVVKELDLKNVKAIHGNVNDIKQQFNFVISRAVTALPDFYKMTKKNVLKGKTAGLFNGIIYLKGGDFEKELNMNTNSFVFEISQAFKEEFFNTKKIVYLW